VKVSCNKGHASSGLKKRACNLQSLSHHSRQATLHPAHATCVFAPRRRFTPRPWPRPAPTSHRSGSPRDKGQRLYAITDSPSSLNPQHQPPTGRRQPAPGTSSMCRWRIFRRRLPKMEAL